MFPEQNQYNNKAYIFGGKKKGSSFCVPSHGNYFNITFKISIVLANKLKTFRDWSRELLRLVFVSKL